MTEEKKKRGRPRKIESFQALKEVMDAPKGDYTVAPLKEYDSEKLNTAADEAITTYAKEKMEAKPTILNGPVFDEGKIQKRINEIKNHEALPFVENPNIELTGNEYTFETQKRVVRKNGEVIPETPYPSNWNELGKLAKLQWLTEHRK